MSLQSVVVVSPGLHNIYDKVKERGSSPVVIIKFLFTLSAMINIRHTERDGAELQQLSCSIQSSELDVVV